MDGKLSAASKEVAVEMVKLSQKKGIKGSKGGWKEFLNFHDKRTGTGFRLSEPSKRPVETLVAFLNTLDKPEDLKFLHDTCAAKPVLKLVSNKIERGADYAYPMASNNVLDVALNKLLVPRIPVNVCCEDLRKVIPGDYYSMLSIFRLVFQDSHGRLQKVIHFQLSKKGITGSVWIRKMANDSPAEVTSERSLEFESTSDDSKKWRTSRDCRKVEEVLQTDKCDGHMKETERLKQELSILKKDHSEGYFREIQRLKQELSQRDLEICRLNATIARLEFYMMHVGMCC